MEKKYGKKYMSNDKKMRLKKLKNFQRIKSCQLSKDEDWLNNKPILGMANFKEFDFDFTKKIFQQRQKKRIKE